MKLTWVKFHLDFFDDPRVKVIETMPESNTMIAIWFKLVALVGGQNTGGRFVLRTGRKESEMPLNEEIIAGIVNESLTTVRLALRTYEQLGMIEAVDDVYVISDWNRIVDEERLRRLEARREAKRLEAGQPKKSRELVVHEYVAAHPDASQVQIARETGVPRSSVQRYLKTCRALPDGGNAQTGVPTPAQKGAHLGAQMGCPPLPMGTRTGTPVGTPETLGNTGLREGAQNPGKDEELDIDIDNTSTATAGDKKNGHPSKRAVRPSLEEVTAFIHAERLPIDPQRFFDWFERHGWATKTGKPLDDWQRMARTWAKHELPAPSMAPAPDLGREVPTVEQIMKDNKVDRSVAQDMLDAGLY